jgi:SAM-dependent methyltransferase
VHLGLGRKALERETIAIADDVSLEAATGTPDYLERNREAWGRWSAGSAATGAKAWRTEELLWGLWNTPESQLGLLTEIPAGGDVVELGCGAGALCAWLERAGFRPFGVDFSPLQLKVAERLQAEHGLSFSLIHANVEDVPFDGASFDVAISEYGASVWSDPRYWLGETHRLLRPDGRLIFFTTGAMMTACTPEDGSAPGTALVRDYFSNYRVEFGSDNGVEFHPTHGDWIRLLRSTGFVIERLIELRPPEGAKARYELVDIEWARRWPSEEIWVARKGEQPAEAGESLQ